jgi:hypothetical protein
LIDVNDDNRDREERRHEEKQREEPERQRREGAKDDVSHHEHLRSGDYRRWLAHGGYVVDAEIGHTANNDEASALAAGQFDKQVWQQQALETVQEAQQSLWALILRLSGCHNSAAEEEFLSSLLAVTTISADDENTLSTIDSRIRSSEMNYRFPDLTKELRLLRSKVENYRLVREIVAKADD